MTMERNINCISNSFVPNSVEDTNKDITNHNVECVTKEQSEAVEKYQVKREPIKQEVDWEPETSVTSVEDAIDEATKAQYRNDELQKSSPFKKRKLAEIVDGMSTDVQEKEKYYNHEQSGMIGTDNSNGNEMETSNYNEQYKRTIMNDYANGNGNINENVTTTGNICFNKDAKYTGNVNEQVTETENFKERVTDETASNLSPVDKDNSEDVPMLNTVQEVNFGADAVIGTDNYHRGLLPASIGNAKKGSRKNRRKRFAGSYSEHESSESPSFSTTPYDEKTSHMTSSLLSGAAYDYIHSQMNSAAQGTSENSGSFGGVDQEDRRASLSHSYMQHPYEHTSNNNQDEHPQSMSSSLDPSHATESQSPLDHHDDPSNAHNQNSTTRFMYNTCPERSSTGGQQQLWSMDQFLEEISRECRVLTGTSSLGNNKEFSPHTIVDTFRERAPLFTSILQKVCGGDKDHPASATQTAAMSAMGSIALYARQPHQEWTSKQAMTAMSQFSVSVTYEAIWSSMEGPAASARQQTCEEAVKKLAQMQYSQQQQQQLPSLAPQQQQQQQPCPSIKPRVKKATAGTGKAGKVEGATEKGQDGDADLMHGTASIFPGVNDLPKPENIEEEEEFRLPPDTPKVIRKRNCLTLEEKVQVLKLIEQGNKIPVIMKKFDTGRSQIYAIQRKKAAILRHWEDGSLNTSRKLLVARRQKYPQLNERVYRWYRQARDRNIHVTCSVLQKQARIFAKEMNCNDFEASNGWVRRFQHRHDVNLNAAAASYSLQDMKQNLKQSPKTLDLII